MLLYFFYFNISHFQLKTDVKQDLKALQRIKEAAEKAKIELSFSHETEINLPYLIGANSFSQKFSRSKLESLVKDLIDRTIPPCKEAMSQANITVDGLSEVILVGGMTRMPKVQQIVKDYFKREPSKSVNPDEAVAMGAAIQGGVLVGQVSDIVLVDITPYSLGVKTLGDIFAPIVQRCTAIPTKKSEIFTTSEDNQTYVDVCVYQGERSMVHQNTSLGDFRLGPIPARPRGMSKIEVTFEIDSSGIVHVSAMDVESNQVAKKTLKSNPRGLTKEELEKQAKEAEKERANDAKLRAAASAKINCESALHDLNSLLSNNESALDESTKTSISQKIEDFHKRLGVSPNKEEKYYLDLQQEVMDQIMKIRDMTKSSEDKPSTSESATEQKPAE